MAERIASHGRGGAGNLGKDDPNLKTQPNEFVTPTLKSEHYTTGRGGAGNLAKNDPLHPEIARASQDVDAPHHREPEGPHHYGRGGAANIITSDNTQRKSDDAKRASPPATEGKGLVEKGKEFLSKFGKK
ncbi:hypothetical protein BDV96DRAFT_503376 [Lophiotrema nucula]|uniref:Uncharacterized protein n=1 Tax=Lophiotrema nucula TaxID=690887 RepID=A0A6A5YPZ2_9PLEO|nr:hypothetical protein BDV96DRAFT_503376 [Lophiotrema nucula]